MEAAPPSYEKATLIDLWDIVARYIPSSDLCAAALVNSRWHATFLPHLWGNPASHFGIENDRVYVALTKFKRTLQIARFYVRSLTHTLHLPPAHAEIYNGPHADWLRDILTRLPNLQSLIVRGLPFFDHAALQALRNWKANDTTNAGNGPRNHAIELPGSAGTMFQTPTNSTPSFGLRLLDASRCPNLTPNELAQGLKRFEMLMYLDLSYTLPARDVAVLSALRRLSGLQVLKLRGIGLKDEGLEVLAAAIGRRVRSLDIRENFITDRGIRTLLELCFILGFVPGTRSPSLLPYLGAEMMEIYQGEEFEGFLRKTFTKTFVSRLAIEDCPEGGLTHLYISRNRPSVEGVSGLVRSARLHVLDVGTLGEDAQSHWEWGMLGAEKLMPVLMRHCLDGLTLLRVDHSLITKDAPASHTDEIVTGRAELADTGLPHLPHYPELDGTRMSREAYELPTGEMTPRYELQGVPVQPVAFRATNDGLRRHSEDDVSAAGPRRGSALAPEVMDELFDQLDLLTPVSTLGESASNNLIPAIVDANPDEQHSSTRSRTYSSIAFDRTDRLNAHTKYSSNLHPAMLPHLRTLILTDVPAFSPNRDTIDRLIAFIKRCAVEAAHAKTQAKLDYSLPPGRRGQASALRYSADKIFALRRLVLEIAPERSRSEKARASSWQHMSTRSMTEDRDSEALWSAAETDFSFFGENEDSDFPSIETGRFANTFGSSEKEVNFGDEKNMAPSPAQQSLHKEPKVGNIAILSAFRRERRFVHETRIAVGADDPDTEGFWDGLVQVVRPSTGIGKHEDVDYYGNKFSNNYLYR